MSDRTLFDLPTAVSTVIPALSSLPRNPDVSLFLDASERWRTSNAGLRELFADTPTLRDTLERLLKQQLDLDAAQAGLTFSASDAHPERFVSFSQACAFVFQHPELDSTLDQRCRLSGLKPDHPLATLTPLQILERLKKLNPEQSHDERWLAFWSTRAPGTAVSRQHRAIELYRHHFQAAAQLALAEKNLTAKQFEPLQLIIDSNDEALTLNQQPVNTEQLALVLSNNSKVKLTGAWVITTGEAAEVSQLLYLPSRPVGVQLFKGRSDMEAWLTRQALVPKGLPTDTVRFEYTAKTNAMIVGASDLFAAHQQAQLNALRNATHGKSDLAEHGAQSLALGDQVDRQRSNTAVFASPPTLEAADGNAGGDDQPLFGSLYADIPLPLRQAALNTQREALEKLVKEDGAGLQSLKDSIKALETCEQDAVKAASALLHLPSPLDQVLFQRELTALHSAHKAGLLAEAKVQMALKQLSSDEFDLLSPLLNTPDDSGPDAVAASLILSMTEQAGDKTTVKTQQLNGVFLVTRAEALADADSPHSVLLYWPGTGGGLQRFANRREFERLVLRVDPQDDGVTVQLKKITGDTLHYSLSQLTDHFEEQAGVISQRHAEPAQFAEQLQALRVRTLASLQVPVHAARSLAFAHLLEQDRSSALASRLPDWLAKLNESDRRELKSLIEAYIPAMKRSHELMTVALESRTDFTRKHLQARLRKDFSIKGQFDVQVDLPDAVKWEKRYTSNPAGVVSTPVMVPGAKRSSMSLEELAQLNIDNVKSVQEDPLSQRLVFMNLTVTTADDRERYRLLNGITLTYLRKVLPELDLPKTYEQLILDAFKGAATEAVFVTEHRRECLIEPWRLMLKLQGECARLQKQISTDELKILNIAIDALAPDAWRADGKRVVILPASLSAGGKDTPGEGPVTLSGVTFIEEQISGVTLLYLPDHPDGQFLRRYDTLQAARKALFNLCQQDSMIQYLAGRALHGDIRAHVSRLNEAVGKNFDPMIGVGTPWPATTSLAAHLLDAHMGRLITAHRDTSRSNTALYFERYALEGPRAFNYIKMALGMMPFVGTAIALYDAWTAANQAVAAFLRGDVGDGVAELKTVLLCLIDAAMDLIPGGAAVAEPSSAARTLTRTRQLRALTSGAAAMQKPSLHQARHIAARFAGYEYEQPITLSGLRPATHGLYRNVYRHADGDFIVRQGRIFKVELSKDSIGWRLSGNHQKTYKQPIALDEAGHWDTHFGVYGTTFDGGGPGGGNLQGHLADTLDPLWPQVIRERLPRWWTDATFRRHHALTESADTIALQIDARVRSTETLLRTYNSAPAASRPGTLMQQVETACIGDIELAGRYHQTLVDLLPLTHGNKKRVVGELQSDTAFILADRYKHRVYFANHRVHPMLNRIDALIEGLDSTPTASIAERLRMLEDIRKVRLEMIKVFDTIEALMRDLNHWYQRITVKAQKAQLTEEVAMLNGRQSEANLLYLKTGNLMEVVTRYDTDSDLSWLLLQVQVDAIRTRVDRSLFNQHSLPQTSVTKAQRNQMLQECVESYAQFRREMYAWSASYPQHFHEEIVTLMMDGLEKMAERARKAIDLPVTAPPAGQISKKVFTTETDQLLIGVERWEPISQQRQYTVTGRGGYEEVWVQGSDNKFRLLNPRKTVSPLPRMSLEALLADARKRLDDLPNHKSRVDDYASRGMDPKSLEHVVISKANELSDYALRIEAKDAQNPMIQTLRNKVLELRATGRQMRTRQSLSSQKPTDDMLDDLIEQNAVEIRKPSPLKNLGKRKDGRTDYMQEYEVWDLTAQPPRLLWYAHFHYTKAVPTFGAFEKAHLKLPDHRFLTHADNPDLPYADIGKTSTVLRHFENI
ncbi:MAG TPA: DUF6543 domain-containing protein [Pseudomonas sp.]|nr:DUF6543 domain-containing protein [Pseudomonas sp.]